jgi:hypothetical protein
METLPLDILLYIIDLLADDEDIKSLQILSQTCKSLVPLCRKHLFSFLYLSKLNSDDLLSRNPDLARYVRSLNYTVYIPISDHVLNILDMLKERSSLRSIELSGLGLDGNDLTESIRSSLISLIQLPTVTCLEVYSFKRFPATVFSGCGNLIDLWLGELNLAPPEVNQVISRSKISTPVSLLIKTDTDSLSILMNSASLYEGGPIVDFSRVQKAECDVNSRGDIDQVNKLIKLTTRLEGLYIVGG